MKKVAVFLVACLAMFPVLALAVSNDEPPVLEPTVTITSPTDGAIVSSPVVIKGYVENFEFDSYSVTVKGEGDSTYTIGTGDLSADLFNPDSLYSWDTTGLPDGSYSIKLSATNGVDTILSTVQVSIGGEIFDENQCKKGGYKELGFRNQGQCVSYGNTHRYRNNSF
ncbi:MAG: hypothetical protein PHX30_04060 [Candidatus Pacebacteria bacterium]|jgi:hypothetical protein|nr:hypothetical protein [Candidatus Paceibacterota bacterium]